MSGKGKGKEPGPGGRLLIELAPLVVFFGAYKWAGIFVATGSFMAAITLAVIVSLILYRKVSALLWFSAFMVLIIGGLTIWFHEEWLIKMKPTLYYLLVSGLLLFGLLTGRNLLKVALGTIYPGLSDKGWRLLTRNWVIFFFVMAILNEIVWRTTSTSFWLGSKIWGFVPATFLFAIANIPMLLRHGLTLEDATEEPPVPPSQ